MKRFAVQVMLYLDAETKNGAIRDVESLLTMHLMDAPEDGETRGVDDYAIQSVTEEEG